MRGGQRTGLLRVVAGQSGSPHHGDLGFAGRRRGRGLGFDHALDGGVQPVGHPFVEAARVDLQVGLVRHEVRLGSGAQHPHGEHRHLAGVDLACDDGLQAGDDGGRDDHRVDAGLRLEPAVAGAAEDTHPHGAGHAQEDSGTVRDHARGLRADPLGEGDVGASEPFVEPVGEHGLGAVEGLLAGLGDDHQGAAPVVAGAGQQVRRADQAGGVRVVAAGVHDRHLLAVGQGAARRAGVGQSGPLLQGQGVHVAAEQHGGSLPVAEDTDDAGAAHSRGDLVARTGQPFGHGPGGAVLLVRQLRVPVQVDVEPLDEREDLVDESHDLAAVFCDTSWIDRLRHCCHRLRDFGSMVTDRAGAPPESTRPATIVATRDGNLNTSCAARGRSGSPARPAGPGPVRPAKARCAVPLTRIPVDFPSILLCFCQKFPGVTG